MMNCSPTRYRFPRVLVLFRTILLFLVSTYSYAQEEVNIDSLLELYHRPNIQQSQRLDILLELAFNSKVSAPDRIAYGDTLLPLAASLKQSEAMIRGHLYKAYAYTDMSDYESDIRETIEAIAIADSTGNSYLGYLYTHLAYTYSNVNNSTEAEHYFRKALDLHLNAEQIDSQHLAASYYTLSDFYLRQNSLDSAYKYLNAAKTTFEKMGSNPYELLLDGNLGVYYFKKGDYDQAKPLIEKGATGLMNDRWEASLEYYNYLIDLAQEQKNYREAQQYAEKALEVGKKTRANTELAKTYLNLYELSLHKKDYARALEYYKTHRVYYDSAINLPTVQRMSSLRNQYEIASKQKEVDLMAKEAEIQQLKAKRQRSINYVSVTIVVLLSLILYGLFNRVKFIRKTSRLIENEKNRSDKLLRNILPDETADELKNFGKVKAKHFESVTVMFTDFQGFTKHSEHMHPEALVNRVDFYFSKFDEIMEKYRLEKIKTMGDAYMCAGGLPFPSENHAVRMVLAAFEILEFVQQIKEESPDDPTWFRIRIGINTGPVVAGVVGTKKFVYDIWGDTVNIAARMESNSVPGYINVSEHTYQLIKDHFDCTFRGMVNVKNKGMMRMYYVNQVAETKKQQVLEVINMHG